MQDLLPDSTSTVWAAVITAMVVTWLATWGVRWIAPRIDAVDHPEDRRVHSEPTPRLGGIAMLVGVLVATIAFVKWDPVSLIGQQLTVQMQATLIAATAIALVGAADDIRGLGWQSKLIGQFGAAGIAVFGPLLGRHVDTVDELALVVRRLDPPLLPAVDLPVVIGALIPIVVIVGSMNMMNFIDGVDGLAAGLAVITAGTFAILAFSYSRVNVAILAAATCGSALGFLPHNFRPKLGGARIFMGDAGSQLLGFLLAVIAIQGLLKTSAAVTLVIPLTLMAVPIFDTAFVMSKRLRHRQSVASADQWHLHHRLLNVGWSPGRVTVMLWLWTASLSVFALALRFVDYRPEQTWQLEGVIIIAALGALVIGFTVWIMIRLEIIKTQAVRERNQAVRDGRASSVSARRD